MLAMEFASSDYNKSRLESTWTVTNLQEIEWRDRYHIYSTSYGDNVVIFSNQKSLLNLVEKYRRSVFAMRLVKEDDPIASYTKIIDGNMYVMRTIGYLGVLASPLVNSSLDFNVGPSGVATIKVSSM